MLFFYPDTKMDLSFHDCYAYSEEGYTLLDDVTLVYNDLHVPDYTGIGYKFITVDNHTHLIIDKDTITDGVTCAKDFKTRMMFALGHDYACVCTRDTANHVYRDALNNTASTTVKMQGGYWFNARLTEFMVIAYSKKLKRDGLFIG